MKERNLLERNSTIATIATPLGEGGIGVVLVSGPDTLRIAEGVFSVKNGRRRINGVSGGELFYGTVIDPLNDAVIDEAIVSVWRCENSATGEDLVEINCHGGPKAVKNTLDAVKKAGATVVGWREFLGRGFENGSIDFIQMEAQEALVSAKTRLSARVLLAQHQGLLSRCISGLEADLEVIDDMISGGVTAGSMHEDASGRFAMFLRAIDKLLDSAVFGLALSSPQRVSIAGAPNVGKSTLFNRLLGEERAIVHHVPGTTRDYVSEYFGACGVPFKLIDAAGLRETDERVEREGVERAYELHKEADKVILMLDGSRPVSTNEWTLIGTLGREGVIPVINKIDAGVVLESAPVESAFDRPMCRISALKGLGLESLEAALVADVQAYIDRYQGNDCPVPVVFTKRQQSILADARKTAAEILDGSSSTNTLDEKALGLLRPGLREFRCGGRQVRSRKVPESTASATDVTV
ncbi:MAG: GTPase [Candidatus Brocadiales bacterium]